MRSIAQNSKTDYTEEDLFNYYLNKILLNWIEEHRPDILKQAKRFLSEELSNK